jgi:NhaA family Na+:H+ antiporter
VARSQTILDNLKKTGGGGKNAFTIGEHQEAVLELEDAAEGVQAPLQRLEHGLAPWVAFVVVPLFALANAGVSLGGDITGTLGQPVTLGVALGLVLGKQVGITVLTWLAVRTGLATLPPSVGWRHIYGASWLAGIGFTTSLFIASLAFGESILLTEAKLGILAGSLVAGGGGWLLLRSAGGDRSGCDR